ncbi:MAG: hypothetical protein JO299_17030 [Gammaproteobacteria bacterium]|nr:hypothetical protein [Gammaproteobacteria bacterium]
MSAKNVQIAHFPSRPADCPEDSAFAAAATHVGDLVSILSDDEVGVAVPGIAGIVAARLAVPLSYSRLRDAIASHQPVVITLDTSRRAIVIGLLEKVPPPEPAAAPEPSHAANAAAETPPQVLEADVDGKRVRIVGGDEIVLECGNASITLRRNGRLIIRGTYVETDSAGTNRIKGAAVRIN